MRIIETSALDISSLDSQETLWVYGGLDSMITREVWDEQRAQLNPETTGAIYNFEKALQGPALCMMMRGFRVDNEKREALIEVIAKKLHRFGGMEKNAKGRWVIANPDALIQQYAIAITGDTLNYNSSLQLKRLLYKTLKIPNHYHWAKGKKTLSTKREILEKISLIYMRATPLVEVLLLVRDMEKELSVLNSKPDADGRWRTSFKPAGTETGRWSSSLTAFKRGFQAQNVTHALREIFIPDPGFTMFYADLKTAESVAVAYLSQDLNYIGACESDDLHTVVAKLVWRQLNWVDDNGPLDRRVAEGPYYRHFSYRDMAKRGGHGTNYLGTPKTMAMHLRCEQKMIRRFQTLYYGGTIIHKDIIKWGAQDMIPHGKRIGNVYVFDGAFPGIRKWHVDTRTRIERDGRIITPSGRERRFWGRPTDDTTIRGAVAHEPQSLVADILNTGLFHVWRDLDGPDLQILAQGHDAILGQVRTELVDTLIPAVIKRMEIPMAVHGRTMTIRADVKLGNNWKEIS